MAYRELIKNFARVRDYMRQFYVYGFKHREEYTRKSPRSYDNERRRIESWLGEYMTFRRDESGKAVFLSVDSRAAAQNPLYHAFRAKSFTDRDITLHFYLLDLLADGSALTAGELAETISARYLSRSDSGFVLDESTLRKKLKEYETLGLLRSEKQGREVRYRRTDGDAPDLSAWAGALAFFSETAPLGVVGAFLEDRLTEPSDAFRFKHHYILHALDSEILLALLEAMGEHRVVELTVRQPRANRNVVRTVCPLKLYVSTQTGRQYLLGYQYNRQEMVFFRLDAVQAVSPGSVEKHYGRYAALWEKFDSHLWGVSTGGPYTLDHIQLTLRVEEGEDFIRQRLEREKRHGQVEQLDEHTLRFSADVYDASEMLPWLRTFTGRILDLQCSDPNIVTQFYDDLAATAALYGGDGHAVP